MSEGSRPESISPLRGWYLAARPATLPAAVVPVLVGTALALSERHFHLLVFLATMLGSLLIQIGTNFANDYYDFRKGADTEERLGPTRVTQSGIFTPGQVALATAITFGLALLDRSVPGLGGRHADRAGGLLSILAGVAYTGGPYPLGLPWVWAICFVFVFFGVIAVTGTYYLQTADVTLTRAAGLGRRWGCSARTSWWSTTCATSIPIARRGSARWPCGSAGPLPAGNISCSC